MPTSLDASQALRLRRFGLAALSYALAAALVATGWMVGTFPGSALFGVADAFIAINLGTYIAIRSGFNLRFQDPSLTRFQILAAITVLMYIVYHLDSDRHIVVSVCFLVFLFGVFRLNAREYRLITLYTLAAYALVINLLMYLRPQAITDVHGEWMSWLIVAGFLACFAIIGGQMNAVRRGLRDSEARFRSLTEMSSDFYWESDADHRITLRVASGKASGATSNVVRGTQIGERRWEVPYVSPDEAGWRAHRADLDGHRPFRGFEISHLGTDGVNHIVLISGDPVFNASGAFKGYRGVGTDITERRRADTALRERESLLSETQAIAHIGSWSWEFKGPIIWTDETYRVYGVSPETFTPTAESLVNLVHPEDRPAMQRWIAACAAGEKPGDLTFRIILPDGAIRYINGRGEPIYDAGNKPLRVAGTAQDITERKRADDALKSSEEKFRKAYDVNPDAVNINRLDDGCYVSINAGFTRVMGYTEDEIVGHSSLQFDIWDNPEDRARLVQGLKKDGVVSNLEVRFRAKDGSIRYGLMSASVVEIDNVPHILSITRDITELTHFQQRLAEGEAQFRGLVEQSIAGTYIVQDGKFAYVNPRYAEIFGYGSTEELIGRDVLSVVAEKDRGIMTENIRSRIDGEIESIKYDFTGLRKDGSIIAVGVHGARATHRGRPAVIGMAQDISEKKRDEEKIQNYVAQLETAFMSTVQVATTLGEMRDPYTAGHQRHVAEIAVAIGAELGFDVRRQEGLRVAGYLHDIGKITIPAEILSKPGKLSAIEYQLIQGHPQSGYDVLKDVGFPWPVAEVALQHHERMDGSGYPQGLKGEAILLDARIMAVADVIEAMSSHRPYRPGLGIEKTLAEIERGRGSAYDPAVVDASLRLFRERLYRLEHTSELSAARTSATKGSHT